jgi:hypothetical protein|tara:strand:+ start:1503 stop:1625 length:123 start_codon:yes stop_codon:yes gene_type:complete
MITEKDYAEIGRIAKIMQEHIEIAQAEIKKQVKISLEKKK